MTKTYKNTDDFIDGLTIKHEDVSDYAYLWKLSTNKDDVVIDYLSSKQTKIDGHLVAPIVICTEGLRGYHYPEYGDGSLRTIYMTKSEVDTFNENFTRQDHKAIRRFARLGR